MFSLSVSKALATRESQARLGSKRPHLRRYLPRTEVLEGRQLLTTGIDRVLPGGAGRTVALAAFEAGQAGSRTWTPISTELRVDQGQTAQLVAARVTTNLAVGTATATIDWGDGVTSSTQAAVYAIDYDPTGAGLDPWGIRVAGEHTYLTPGTYNVRTTITTAGVSRPRSRTRLWSPPRLSLSSAAGPGQRYRFLERRWDHGDDPASVPGQCHSQRLGSAFRHTPGRWDAVPDRAGRGGCSRTLVGDFTPARRGAYQITARAASADGRVLPPIALAVGNAGGPLVVDTTRASGCRADPQPTQCADPGELRRQSFRPRRPGTLNSNGPASSSSYDRARPRSRPGPSRSPTTAGRSFLV